MLRVFRALRGALVQPTAQDRAGAASEHMQPTVMRPDHVHDAFFRANVDRGLRNADDPHCPRIPHEEVMDKMKTRLEGRIVAVRHADRMDSGR